MGHLLSTAAGRLASELCAVRDDKETDSQLQENSCPLVQTSQAYAKKEVHDAGNRSSVLWAAISARGQEPSTLKEFGGRIGYCTHFCCD